MAGSSGRLKAAATREARIDKARDLVYRGFVAEAIDRFCRTNEVMDVSGRRHRGLLTGQDMAGWKATYEEPLTYDYRNYTVCKTGPWGQGPVFLQQLALLKGFDLDAMDPNGPDFVHTVIECMKLAFADREAYYGDPDFVDVPMEALLSDAYNDERRKLVGDTRLAGASPRPHTRLRGSGRPGGAARRRRELAAPTRVPGPVSRPWLIWRRRKARSGATPAMSM